MLDHEDLKWIAATSTELNTMLQQIARHADLARQHKGEYSYLETLGEQAEVASKAAQSLFDRVTARILAEKAPKTAPSSETPRTGGAVAPPPSKPAAPVETSPNVSPGHLAGAAKAPSGAGAPSPAKPGGAIPADIKILNEKGIRELLLFVEDEREIAELAAAMLTDEGYRVILARDGFEALKIYQQISRQIGLVILDYFLPVMDGDAVFDELCALNPEVAVVLSSGFNEQSKLGTMLARGLRGFIPKPYTREKLLAQVRSILDATREPAR